MDFLEALYSRAVVGDGAMGTLLFERGVPRDACLEDLCVREPERIQAIHREYLSAGAQFIRTHSFGANAARLARFGFERRVGELNWHAARTAREAAKGSGSWIAASVGPTGLEADEGADFLSIFQDQLGALLDGGADFVILETFTDLNELKAAIEAKHSLHHCPVVASLAGIDPVAAIAAFAELRVAGADVVGINCYSDHAKTRAALSELDLSEPVSAFPNAGLPTPDREALRYPIDADTFAAEGAALVELGVRVIGGCCGTNPDYIAALVERLKIPAQA
jgi:methionine synthase / methylenetetrahydrofolate reductase (NADH)